MKEVSKLGKNSTHTFTLYIRNQNIDSYRFLTAQTEKYRSDAISYIIEKDIALNGLRDISTDISVEIKKRTRQGQIKKKFFPFTIKSCKEKVQVINFINMQSNKSIAVNYLIEEYVRNYGIVNIAKISPVMRGDEYFINKYKVGKNENMSYLGQKGEEPPLRAQGEIDIKKKLVNEPKKSGFIRAKLNDLPPGYEDY